jgi:Flp pilus assembly protein TadB
MADQRFYDQVAREIASQQLDKGLWVRAFSDTGGNESKAQAAYIALRVRLLKAQEQAEQEAAAAREAQQRVQEEQKRAREKRDTGATNQPPSTVPTWLQDGFRPLHKDPVVLSAIFFLLLALLLASLFGLNRM